jgi:hypothetical protein
LRQKFEKKPANVRVEKTFADVVRIFFVIDVLVVPAMFARPHQHGILERSRAEEENKHPDWPSRVEGQVREQAVISERDAKPARREHDEKQHDLKPIDAGIPEIDRDRGESEEQGADQERAGRPVDAIERNAKKHAEARFNSACGEAINARKAVTEPGLRPFSSRYELSRSARS